MKVFSLSPFIQKCIKCIIAVMAVASISFICTQPIAHAGTHPVRTAHPNSFPPDYCLTVKIISTPTGIYTFTSVPGIGQVYTVTMQVINGCGQTLNSGGQWDYSNQIFCGSKSLLGVFLSGSLPTIGAGSSLTVVDRGAIAYCSTYDQNGKEIKRSLPNQVTSYGNASSTYTINTNTIQAIAPLGTDNLF